jgi:hypothetical protein
MKIYAARDEDIHEGWVWIQDPTLPPRVVVRILNPANRMAVYCEAMQIDQNFLRLYNQPSRLPINQAQGALVIGAWYRAKLGGFSPQSEVPLEIERFDSWIGHFHACIDHPQVVVRQGAWLGGLGLVLGLLGLALGILSLR